MSVFRRNRGATGTQNARTRTISSPTGFPDEMSTDGRDTISSTEYSRKCREFMELYRDLLALGFVVLYFSTAPRYSSSRRAKTIFDLPRVVVIGGQSSELILLFYSDLTNDYRWEKFAS